MMGKGSPKLNCTSSEAAIGLYRVVCDARGTCLCLCLSLDATVCDSDSGVDGSETFAERACVQGAA